MATAIIVTGSGIGGLVAGALLAHSGKQVVIPKLITNYGFSLLKLLHVLGDISGSVGQIVDQTVNVCPNNCCGCCRLIFSKQLQLNIN